MQEVRRKRATVIGLRAGLPAFARVLALVALVAGLVFVGVSYYRLRNNKPFRLRSGAAELSKEVVGIIENYEQRVTDGNRLKLLLRSTRAITFSDGHRELENVHLEVYPETGDRPDKISSQRTITNEDNSLITFTGAVDIETRDRLRAKTEAIDYDVRSEVGTAQVPITFERENVRGRADAATIDAKNKKLELRGGVEITVEPQAAATDGASPVKVNPRDRPVTVKSARANFDQASMHLVFSGGATAEQSSDIMSGETLAGTLNQQKKLQKIEARGNSYLRSMNAGRAAEVHSADMDFYFDAEQQLERAYASRDVRGRSLDADSELQLTTAGDVNVVFDAQGERSLLKEMLVGGRPVIVLSAPKSKANDPAASNTRLTADSVKLLWHATGRDLQGTEAVGNAELLVEPVNQTPQSERKMMYGARFDGEFYESGNQARIFTASGGAKAVVEPLQPTPERATRTLTAQKMIANFARATQAVEKIDALGDAKFYELERTLTAQNMYAFFSGETKRYEKIEAQGDVKFNERDRNAQSASAVYTAADEVIRLRGGEPVVWDARARMKAAEIDSDTRRQVSYGRGKSSTTYYSQEQTNGATPFAKVKSPVFIVANDAEIRHAEGTGIYKGNARMWQDDNFVKSDTIILRRETRRMDAEGNVQSALYNARRKEASGARAVVPVFATSSRMFYADADRLIHYEGNVDIKQGTERITSDVADVYLRKDAYEVERTVAQRNVVLTQPGKRGTGDWAQYNATDETMILTGIPARVVDTEQGTSESRRLTVYLRENRVVSDGGESKNSSGRVRSTHKINKQ
ncbi:MAG TPA: LPS export ABC transporter periplasmic protein LptC [Pyrinomonadaceae bacterium]|nr:LPS export ABC transporter periplasmic protein LptC [Pyrinomonadaceae bacterium]